MRNDMDDCCGLGAGSSGETLRNDHGDCHTEHTALERVRYFPRQLLTVEEMETEFEYFREKGRRHNRFLHGVGVVCGLDVTAAATPESPLRVRIDCGYAFGPYGDEIFVGAPVFLDLAKCGPNAATDPCEPDRIRDGESREAGLLYVAIKFAECLARPVRPMPAGCACDDQDCEYSRIRDSFQISCLSEPPPLPETPLLCDLLGRPVPCPPCPTSPWIVLAKVTLPLAGGTMSIDTGAAVRPQIFSTAILQRQLIECCCKPREVPRRPPVTVVSVDPPDGARFEQAEGSNAGLPERVVITFDKSLNPATVQPGIRVEFTDPSGSSGTVPGTATYDDSMRRAIFVPQFPPFTSAFQRTERTYTVIVQDSIIDVDNLHLDGDKDGDEGPEFRSRFIIDIHRIF